MSLYKRGGVYWSYIWINNVRHSRSLQTGKKQEAIRREIDFRSELDLSRHTTSNLNPEMVFSKLAARFIGSGLSKPYHIERLDQLLPYFGDTPLNQITKPLAEQYRLYRIRKKGVTESTVNHDLSVLRRVLFFALDNGILLANPMSRVRMARLPRVRQPILSLEEEQPLLEMAPPHLRRLIIAALDTGMRRGELFAQCAEDIDLFRKVLAVTHSKTAGGEQREIPLTARMVGILQGMPRSGLIFTYKGGKLNLIKTSWATAVRNAGIRQFNFRHLRHTFNTRLMEAGVIQDVRMSLMGHSQGRARSTNDIYTHVDLRIIRQAIQRLEEWTTEQQKEIAGRKEAEKQQEQ